MNAPLLKAISLKKMVSKTPWWLKRSLNPKRNESKCEAINGAHLLVITIGNRGLKICLENCKYESGKIVAANVYKGAWLVFELCSAASS